MLLDGLAQGTGTLAVYDADIFQMCQIGVVQIFIEGGEGFVRACYAASMKDIAESIARMDNFLTNLRRKQGRSEG